MTVKELFETALRLAEEFGDNPFNDNQVQVLDFGENHFFVHVIKIYHSNGHFVTLTKEFICDEDQVKDDDYKNIDGLQEDGYDYQYYDDTSEGFKAIDPKSMLKLLAVPSL